MPAPAPPSLPLAGPGPPPREPALAPLRPDARTLGAPGPQFPWQWGQGPWKRPAPSCPRRGDRLFPRGIRPGLGVGAGEKPRGAAGNGRVEAEVTYRVPAWPPLSWPGFRKA